MTLYYYSLISIFAIVAVMIALDKNVATYIDLMFRYGAIQVKRFIWIVKFHPKNPITRWAFERRIQKMTKELQKDLKIDHTND